MNNDCINRIICPALNLRIYTVNTLDTVKKITAQHKTTPNATFAMGQAINATALLSATLKPDSNQNIRYRIQGNGPLKEIHVQADARGNIRAYTANPSIDLNSKMSRISFSDAIGAGMLSISKDLNMKEPYSSVSPILQGSIAKDTAYYLTQSEQIPSAIMIGFELNKAGNIIASGGILIQTFPDTPERSIELVEKNIKTLKIPLYKFLEKGEEIISFVSELLNNKKLQLLSTTKLRENCRCDKNILKNILKQSGPEELTKMVTEDHGAEITCTFCSKKHIFSESELKVILDNISG